MTRHQHPAAPRGHRFPLAGQLSSSYLDSVILRERDNTNGWRGAADGTLEERRFYGQNWRADVALVMKATGRPLERIKYSAYGVATLKPGYDYNGDGVIDADDLGDIITDAASPTPPASADWNLDGTPNTTDSAEYQADYYALTSTSWAYGDLTLADTGNRKGYAGYELDPLTDQYHVRHRVYEPQLGRWTKRDPLGYVDGVSVYEYVRARPVRYTDPRGLWADGCFYDTPIDSLDCDVGLGDDVGVVQVGGGGVGGGNPPPATNEQCCAAASRTPPRDPLQGPTLPVGPSWGAVVCCNGEPIVCAWGPPPSGPGSITPPSLPVNPTPLDDPLQGWRKGLEIVTACTRRHEEVHVPQVKSCRGSPNGTRPPFDDDRNQAVYECEAYKAEVDCLMGMAYDCARFGERARAECNRAVEVARSSACSALILYCGKNERPGIQGCP